MLPSSKLAIRLALHGCKNRPFYHIVVMNKHKSRDAPVVEQLGTFDPLPNKHGEKLFAINYDRLQYYLGRGVYPTKPLSKLLGLAGYFPLHPMTYIQAKRNRKLSAEQAQKEALKEYNKEHNDPLESALEEQREEQKKE